MKTETWAKIKAGIKAFFAKILQPFQEQDGLLSMRRCMAAYFAIISTFHLRWALPYVAAAGWIAFLPGLACILATLLLLFFTTWADITELVKTALGMKTLGDAVPRS
ncbi:MAG: hypothetical protein IMZ50_11865 [Candidatus Atribacteria bacterium]|nr:hypothetical protein [Spirochaetota bacterium]MBE3119432.1 hypothetical protein [Candidatus Atribacteria bacterium]